ncbi:hypothetical protein HDV02_002834 [Globomyces sp. JEL0801]|nr:hypothetical protein HDV02_002834 [Globomyces sp. JEL0801]
MDRWINESPIWKSVTIPLQNDYWGQNPVIPISSTSVLVCPMSQLFRHRDTYPRSNDFWIIQVDFSNECKTKQLELPNLSSTNPNHQLQVVHYTPSTRELLIVLKDFDEDRKVSVLKYELVVDDSIESIEFKLKETCSRISYSIKGRSDQEKNEDYEKLLNVYNSSVEKRTVSDNGIYVDENIFQATGDWESRINGPHTYNFYNVDDKSLVGSLSGIKHHVNHTVQAFSGDFVLLPAVYSGQDAYYDEMRLFNWRTQELVKTIYLEKTGFIETEWRTGLLPNSSTFFHSTSSGDHTNTTMVCFYGVP